MSVKANDGWVGLLHAGHFWPARRTVWIAWVLLALMGTSCLPPAARTPPPAADATGAAPPSSQLTQTAGALKPSATPRPTSQPTICPPIQEKVGEQWVWYPASTCNKGIAYSISATSARVVDLKFEDPKATAEDFKMARLVAKFEVRDSTNRLVESFSSPMRLYLVITGLDVANAKSADKLVFAYVNEKNTWMKFTQTANGYTLLKAKTDVFPPAFEYLDSGGKWKPVKLEGTTYIFNSNKVAKIEIDSIYQRLKTYQDFVGFAYVQVSAWPGWLIGLGT